VSYAVCILFFNIIGGIGLTTIFTSYEEAGYALFASVPILLAGLLFACFRKITLPLILDVIGSGCYIYAMGVIYAIPHEVYPKYMTEPVASRHLPGIIFSILLVILCVINYLMKEKKPPERKTLSDSERII
jgi:hypothetical protein